MVAVAANGNKEESTKTFVVGSSSSDETLKGYVNRDGSVTVADATLVPVSYTHLDVYKRQCDGRIYANIVNKTRSIIVQPIDAVANLNGCLLYTS